MTKTTAPYDAICAAVLERNIGVEGALHAVFLDARHAVLLTIDFDEGTGHVDELFLRHVVAIVNDIRVAAVVFAVRRCAGRPTRVDKLLWRELSARLADGPTAVLDVVVVGESRRSSVAQSVALRAPVSRVLVPCQERPRAR
jgi:DNA repair protein RadC